MIQGHTHFSALDVDDDGVDGTEVVEQKKWT